MAKYELKSVDASLKLGEQALKSFMERADREGWFENLELRNALWFVEHEIHAANFSARWYIQKYQEQENEGL